jgi:outer membrane lipoprotein-sorting protein
MTREAPMRLNLTALPLLASLLVACSSPSPVDEVVAANLAARGGKARLQALRSIRETGTATASGGRVARVVREIKRPGMFRLEFTYQGTTSVFAHDGVSGWQVAPLQGQFEPQEMTPEAEATAGVDQRDIEGALVDWRAKGHTVELVGREKLAGGEADKLKVTLKGGAIRYDWVDVASHQVVRSDVTRMVRGRPTQLENTFSDFRAESGLVFPHLIQTHVKDRPQTITIAVEKIELDPDLDDARFRFPR